MISRLQRFLTDSLRRQLILGISLVHALLMTLFVFDLVERQRDFLRQQSEKQAMSLSRSLAASSLSWVLANDVVGLEEVLRSLLSYPELRYAMILSPHGKVMGHSDSNLSGKFVVDEISRNLLDGTSKPAVLVSDGRVVDAASPILFKGERIGWARISLGQSANARSLKEVIRDGLVYTLVAILVGTLFALAMARGMTRGLYQLLEVAEAIRQGRRDVRAPSDRWDELGSLAVGFNRMLDGLMAEEEALLRVHQRLAESQMLANEANHHLIVSYDNLQRERNKLSTIIHTIREGIVVTDSSGAVVMVNPATERLLRKSPSQIEAEGFSDLVDDPEFVRSCLVNEGDGSVHTLHYKGLDLHFYASTFREGQQAIGSMALIRDITEETRLREQLREIIDKAPFGIVVADDQGTVRLFNPESTRLFGCEVDEIVGRPVVDLMPPVYRSRHEERIRERFIAERQSATRIFSFEAEGLRQDGSVFPIRMAINRMVMDGRFAIVAMIVDMTEERRLLDDLIQSEKMAGLGGMVAGVAHEINTPVGIGVTAISELQERTTLFERMVHAEGISEEDLDAFLGSTKRLVGLTLGNLERAADLVRSFKSVAVDQSSEKLRTFRVKAYVESAVLTMHHQFKNRKLTTTVLCDTTLEILSYPGVLSQIVINLLNNSLLHGFDPEESGQIVMEFVIKECKLHFTYRDDGHGMSEESCRKVFEPFYTTRRDRGGSGLGMHIVYNLVTQSFGGTITCQSSPGQGVLFHITMPILTDEKCIVSDAQE